MLSYRHAFHAGNHADVFKHFTLVQVLCYFNKKNKPYWYIDTHAGAGMYALNKGYALQNAEFANGIAKLLNQVNISPALYEFKHLIQSFNAPDRLDLYPGSPAIARHFIRAEDKIRLFELHPSDYKLLLENFIGEGHQTKIEMQDGFTGIKSLLPPPTRRAIVLIDPPYEEKQDYQRVVQCVNESLQRFATGTYMIWYPLLQRDEPQVMIKQLKSLNISDWINVSLSIQAPAVDGFGMFGSGLFIINPPWTLPSVLQENIPLLRDSLALDAGASFVLETHIT